MNRRFMLAGTGLLALGGYGLWTSTQRTEPGVPFGSVSAQTAEIDTSIVQEMSLGNPDAAVTVIEYASFTCPHCRTFHEGPFKQLKTDYIDTGKIHFIYREVYFDRFGLWAGMLARCAGPERYFGLTELLYSTQSEWTSGGDPATVADNLRRLGRTAGLSNEAVDACLLDGDKAQALVAVYQQNAEADDISSTPSFLINGRKYGNMRFDEFAEIIEAQLN